MFSPVQEGPSMCVVAGPLPERRRSEPPKPPKHLFRMPHIRRVSIGPTLGISQESEEDLYKVRNIIRNIRKIYCEKFDFTIHHNNVHLYLHVYYVWIQGRARAGVGRGRGTLEMPHLSPSPPPLSLSFALTHTIAKPI